MSAKQNKKCKIRIEDLVGDVDPNKFTTKEDIIDLFDKWKAVELQTVDKSTLVDLRDVKLDKRLSQNNRMLSYIKQIKNPYVFKVGDMAVKISFIDTDRSFKSALESVFRFSYR